MSTLARTIFLAGIAGAKQNKWTQAEHALMCFNELNKMLLANYGKVEPARTMSLVLSTLVDVVGEEQAVREMEYAMKNRSAPDTRIFYLMSRCVEFAWEIVDKENIMAE